MCLRGSDAWCADRFGSSQWTSASRPLMKAMPPKSAAVAIRYASLSPNALLSAKPSKLLTKISTKDT